MIIFLIMFYKKLIEKFLNCEIIIIIFYFKCIIIFVFIFTFILLRNRNNIYLFVSQLMIAFILQIFILVKHNKHLCSFVVYHLFIQVRQ